MNKILSTIFVALLMCNSITAQETNTHDNRLYITIDTDNDDISSTTISLRLDNPTLPLTAVEAFITIPEGATLSEGTLSAVRCDSSHELTEGDIEGSRFVSIVSPSLTDFTSTEGILCTWTCDLSLLPDGVHTFSATGMFAVEVADSTAMTYPVADQSERITKSGTTVTDIRDITADSHTGQQHIYNLQGVRLSKPQPGQINIINGKKIRL